MNRDFLIHLQWYTVLADWTWTLFHLWKMLYQGPEGSSTPGKPVLPWRQVNVLAIYSESNRQYRFFDPTALAHSADWLNLNTFPHAEDALPRTKGLLIAWKNGFIIHSDGKSMFWPCYWIAPWIHTFWTQGSGIQSWLAPPEYQSTHGASQD